MTKKLFDKAKLRSTVAQQDVALVDRFDKADSILLKAPEPTTELRPAPQKSSVVRDTFSMPPDTACNGWRCTTIPRTNLHSPPPEAPRRYPSRPTARTSPSRFRTKHLNFSNPANPARRQAKLHGTVDSTVNPKKWRFFGLTAARRSGFPIFQSNDSECIEKTRRHTHGQMLAPYSALN